MKKTYKASACQSTLVNAFAHNATLRLFDARASVKGFQMKSPNTTSNSALGRALLDLKERPLMRVAIAFALIAPAVFCSCKTTESELASRRSTPDPYSKYDPKTPEEEAYYRDVYSGSWEKESMGGVPTISKHDGSLTLPEHWRAMPPGAKTLEEIRTEAAQRKMAQNRAMPGKATPPVSAQMQPAYGTPYIPGTVPTAPSVPPAPPATPETTPYANPAAVNSYFSQNASNYNAPSSTNFPISSQVTPGVAVGNMYAQASSVPVQPQYVAQATNNQAVQTNTAVSSNAAGVAQPQSHELPQSSPTVVTPPTSTPTVGPQLPGTPTNAYPTHATSAAWNLFDSAEWIVRGQEPNEDDAFAAFDDDESIFDDSEEAEIGASVASDGKDNESNAQQDFVPVVEISSDNVNVKAVAPEAVAPNVVEDGAEASAESGERIGGIQLPLKIDPSIASPYADVKRPVANPSAPSDSDAPRDKLDEYVVGGGDSKGEFHSRQDWSIENLDPEDAVAHFDAVDGRILSEPTNRVFIYSPRFGAARQALAALEGAHSASVGSANLSVTAMQRDDVAQVDVREQATKALGATGSQSAEGAEAAVGTTIASGRDIPIEGSAQLRLAAMLTSDTVSDLSANDSTLMLDGALAAQGWSGEQGVAVAADLVNAFSNAYVEGAATIYHIKDDTKTSKLRIIKIANKDAARPGEFVEFTLRFENIGDEPIGNVTILDNLSARLRYVEGTAQSSVQADFLADLSETGSLVLRWEIEKPLMPKEFGVVRFICKVQ